MSRTNLAIVLVSSIAGALAGALTTTLLSPSPSSQVGAADAGDSRLGEIAANQAKLQQAIADLRSSQALLAERSDRTAMSADAPAAKQASEGSAADKASEVEAAAAPETEMTVESALAQLDDPDLSHAELTAVWDKVHKAGLTDALVKSIEERAAREPNNPDLRVALGNAYLQELFVSGEMSKGKWAMKADSAFDAALELNPEHWEARFTKAVSLSHWPPIFGKQGQAIAEFETLIKQQNAGAKQNEHAQTYIYLGNMYQGSGSVAKAIEAWQKGLDIFPDNAELKQHIADAKKL
ncbi:MAG TPA: hypothetical protein VK843_09355 [Planctomycetota bacterium]|nr:hypothetical protein [Planctomycetota bacterium]